MFSWKKPFKFIFLFFFITILNCEDTILFASAQDSESPQELGEVFITLDEKLETFKEGMDKGEVDVSTLLGKFGKVGRYQIIQAGPQPSELGDDCQSKGTKWFKFDTVTGDTWMLEEPGTKGMGDPWWIFLQTRNQP